MENQVVDERGRQVPGVSEASRIRFGVLEQDLSRDSSEGFRLGRNSGNAGKPASRSLRSSGGGPKVEAIGGNGAPESWMPIPLIGSQIN